MSGTLEFPTLDIWESRTTVLGPPSNVVLWPPKDFVDDEGCGTMHHVKLLVLKNSREGQRGARAPWPSSPAP